MPDLNDKAQPVKPQRRYTVRNDSAAIKKRTEEVSPLSLFGASAMVFPDKISTTRTGMAVRHTSQRVVLTDPEFPMLYSGAENEYGKRSSWYIKAKSDYKLMKIFKKFKDAPHSPVAYIFQDMKTGKYKCEVIKPSVNLIEKYGFRMYNKITNYQPGDIIPEGTAIAQSSSYVDDNYCAGINVRMANAVLPELTEDALVLSEEIADRLAYDMVDVVEVNIGENAFLLNKYGHDGIYKPFPDIGEYIQNNILCSVRENAYVSSVAEASIPHINDKKYFSNGIVVDIDIFTNTNVENEQFNYYYSQIRTWYSDIYSYISTIVTDKEQDDTTLLDIYHQAEKYLNNAIWATKEYLVDTLLRFTILQPKKIHPGQKVVGRYGNKSVVAEIVKTDLMPKTDDGRPIHMLTNALAVPNRIISFSTYESTITFQAERLHQHFKKLYEEKGDEARDEIVRMTAEFLSFYDKEQGSEVMRLYNEYPNETFDDIITNGIFVKIQPLNEQCVRDAILNADEHFKGLFERYKVYTKLRHRWIELDEKHAIGYQYLWVLKQEPSKSMSCVSTGRTTLYDLPVKTRQYNKNLRHYSDNPIRFGEYDTYNFLAGVGVKAFAKLTTYFRGSQYEENSILMSQLNDMNIDLTKYNKFPQIDNLKNILKFIGVKLTPDVFNYNTIGAVDEKIEILFNNVPVSISISDLHYILIMHSYYLQYEQYVGGIVDMIDFLDKMLKTNLFEDLDNAYVSYIFKLFGDMLPILQQLKQYT